MLRYRPIDIRRDRQVLLVIHCQVNYASDTPQARKTPYEEYWEKWMRSPQPEQYLTRLKESLDDKRTFAEFVEDEHGTIIGYLWVIFEDIEGYDRTIAYVMDIAVMADFRGQGVGTEIMGHIEEVTRVRGANLLRSDTGIENEASQKLHEKLGFKPYHILYEKDLKA
jgi:GNAT superfamily N-acetyltransferase